MLRSLRDLEPYSVHATDGDVGKVVDFFLDDERWGVRYLVVDAGALVRARRVVVSPASFREADGAEGGPGYWDTEETPEVRPAAAASSDMVADQRGAS